jgi:D-serine deaminase-like pyridoxal phosphate-dependent protein
MNQESTILPWSGPTLLLDRQKCQANIRRMADKAARNGILFRPHFKTHQSVKVGRWFRDAGVECITVSSVAMARYFAAAGWKDITLAFPVNLFEIKELLALSASIRLNLTVTDESAVSFLDRSGIRCGIFIEIDAGHHRTGLDSTNLHEVGQIIRLLTESGSLEFSGFLSHFGNTYATRSTGEVREVFRDSMACLRSLQEAFPGSGIIPVSIGDTPSCSILDDLRQVSEIRPGNFVFYDVMQYLLGSCTAEDIAVCLAAPVVFNDPGRLEAVVHGGAVHLSKDRVVHRGTEIFGMVVKLTNEGWSLPLEGCFVRSLSQEHGVLQLTGETFSLFHPGEVAGILPVHACLTVSAMRRYLTLDGEWISCMDPLTA